MKLHFKNHACNIPKTEGKTKIKCWSQEILIAQTAKSVGKPHTISAINVTFCMWRIHEEKN